MFPSPLPFAHTIVQGVGYWKYPTVFVIAIIEGPVLMLACGFLLSRHMLELSPTFTALVTGDLVGDMAYYVFGRFFAEPLLQRKGHVFSLTPELLEKGKKFFRRYHVKILLISKMTLGFGMALATLTAAGATRIRVGTFLWLNFLGEVVLVSIMLALGYFFGNLFSVFTTSLQILFIIGTLLLMLLALYGISKYVKQKIIS